jgi:ubiquinone/menaquinone biosynthesis C-methylase UbiE
MGLYAPFNIANLMSIQQRERLLVAMLAKHGLSDLSGLEILDVGCGAGGGFLRLMAWGASPRSLHGVDLRADLVLTARAIHPDLDVAEASAAALPWQDGRFDLVTQFTAFTSMPDAAIRGKAAKEVDRVLKPGGWIVWYDFWINPTNPAVHPIREAELRGLFPGYLVRVRRATLAPPIARLIAPRSQSVASFLQGLWFLQSHLAAVLTKPGSARRVRDRRGSG